MAYYPSYFKSMVERMTTSRGQRPSKQCFLEKIVATDSSLEFEWNISDFVLLENTAGQRYCPRFQFLGAEWAIGIYLMMNNYSLCMLCTPNDRYSHLSANYTMEIKCSDGTVYKSVRSVVLTGCLMKSELSSRSALIKDKEKVVPQGVLTIFCNISVDQKHCEKVSAGLEKQNEISEGIVNLGKNLKNLLTSGEDSDVVMKVGDKEFRAHRAILRARSTVFASMFRHDMKERGSGTVDITDCDPEAFEQFLLYVYTGKVDCLSIENVCQLYQLSDKYDIQDLKTECVEYIKKNLSADNFCDVISLALRHNESELLETTTQFFVKNGKKIVTLVNWLSFLKENPVEANELTIKMLNVVVPD